MATINPNPKKLVVLKANYKDNEGSLTFLFPLNPTDFTVNQVNRVGTVFTYGEKVFQNLGRGLKTVTISGHTGYRLDYSQYGLSLAPTGDTSEGSQATPGVPIASAGVNEVLFTSGANLFMDLYGFIQLIKGENIFVKQDGTISDTYTIENIDKIQSVQLIVPDQSIVYDVIIQNDQFLRNREQPFLYKYSLTFIVTDEAYRIGAGLSNPTEIPLTSLPERLKMINNARDAITGAFDTIEKGIRSIPFAAQAIDGYKTLMQMADNGIAAVNVGIQTVNEKLNDLRRLEKLNTVLKSITTSISSIRQTVQLFQAYGNLSAFYETKIYAKQLTGQLGLLSRQFESQKNELSWQVNLTRLSSTNTPVTIAANKATIAQTQKDIRFLGRTGFPIPISEVKEVKTNSGKQIYVYFSSPPISLDITDIKIFTPTDFGQNNNLVLTLDDEKMILNTSFELTGYVYNFQIEYNYKTFETIDKPRYRSIRRVKIKNGDKYINVLNKYSPTEMKSIPTYEAEVAYLNNLEFPYIVTQDDVNMPLFEGSHASKVFDTQNEFLQFISNIFVGLPGNEGPALPLYEYSDVSSTFLIDDVDLRNALEQPFVKFFVVLFKETYSNRLYALFGLFTNEPSTTKTLFEASSYYLYGVEKGKTYEVTENVIWEILSPYNLTDDLIDFYSQRDFVDSQIVGTEFFDREMQIIQNIYVEYVGEFSANATENFTADWKQFFAGDENNQQYVLLTNFNSTANFNVSAYKKYKILNDDEYILLPSLSNKYLSFENAINKEDVYKVDIDLNLIQHEIIRPRPDLGTTAGELELPLINGVANVKQAIRHRLITPAGGLRLHPEYGLPQLLGQKNTFENLILLKYSMFEQISSDPRVKLVQRVDATSNNDVVSADSSVILVNNDEVAIRG